MSTVGGFCDRVSYLLRNDGRRSHRITKFLRLDYVRLIRLDYLRVATTWPAWCGKIPLNSNGVQPRTIPK